MVMFDYQTAEFAVVGCLLIDERCLPPVREVLPSADAFANENCRSIYEVVCGLADKGKPIDPVTVGTRTGLENRFLLDCMELAPSCNSAPEYARAVMEGYKRRQLREIGEKLQSEAFAHDTDSTQILTDARAALDGLANNAGSAAVHGPFDSLQNFLVFRADVNEGNRQTIKIGFPALDSILGGFAQGGLYIVAARPGVGKSAFGIAVADMVAKSHRVLYASLEMTEEELNARRIAAFSDAPCSFGKLLFGRTTEAEDAAVVNACSALYERKLYISAVSSMTVAELGIQARNMKADVVIVDYLGLLSCTDRKMGEYEKITQISGDLKRLAKQLKCVVLALCQLNRESANSSGNTDSRPKLSQLRSSGAIEQDADGVMLLHRPEYGRTDIDREPTAPQQFFVDVAKNRHGRTGTIELAWYAPCNRFEDRSSRWTAKSWV